MREQLGTLLWELRTAQGWTLGKLAKQAGISKAAISQWETGKRQPRIAELETVLDTLAASATQRMRLLVLIEAPRALRHLRRTDLGMTLGAPPVAGDMLRAMRLRKRWTQEQVAHHLGIHRTTITQWEKGERWPAAEQLHALCFALDAREEEMVVLTTGRFAEMPQNDGSLSWEEKAQNLHLRLTRFREGNLEGAWELLFFGLEREAWMLTTENAGAAPALASVLAHHAEQQARHKRWTEVGALSDRALTLSRLHPMDEDTRLRAALTQAAAAVYAGYQVSPERGLSLLKNSLNASSLPEFTAWILRDMAEYALLAGHVEAGLTLSERAVNVAKQSANPIESLLRMIDFGRILVAAGQPGKALEQLPLPCDVEAGFREQVELVRVEALLALGRHSEAQVGVQALSDKR